MADCRAHGQGRQRGPPRALLSFEPSMATTSVEQGGFTAPDLLAHPGQCARRDARIFNNAFDNGPQPCRRLRRILKSVGEVNGINNATLQGHDKRAVLFSGTPGPQHLPEQVFITGIWSPPLDFYSRFVNQRLP